MLVFMWKFICWLPRWAPQLAKKLGLGQGADDVRQHFYRQCLRLLHRAGFVRPLGQTASEYTHTVGEKLFAAGRWNEAPRALSVLTAAYYRLRFGGRKTLSAEENHRVTSALDELERKLK
jgi:hypothetical protein